MTRGFGIFFLILAVSFSAYVPDVLSAVRHECYYCHITSDKPDTAELNTPLAELCIRCHADEKSQQQHKVGITQSMKVEGLPLSGDGKLTCITCHDPHGKSGYANLLRVSPKTLCSRCHII